MAVFFRDDFLGCAAGSGRVIESPPISISPFGSIGLGAAELGAVLGLV